LKGTLSFALDRTAVLAGTEVKECRKMVGAGRVNIYGNCNPGRQAEIITADETWVHFFE